MGVIDGSSVFLTKKKIKIVLICREILDILYANISESVWSENDVSREFIENALTYSKKEIEKAVHYLRAKGYVKIYTSLWFDDWTSVEITSASKEWYESLVDRAEFDIEKVSHDILEMLKAQYERSKNSLFGSSEVSLDKLQDVLNYRQRHIEKTIKSLEAKGLVDAYTSILSGKLIEAKITEKGIKYFDSLIKTKRERTTQVESCTDIIDKLSKKFEYDVFICHASEDKDSFVKSLAIGLSKKGVRVWYDDFTLKIGDSLRRSIDKGLLTSQYGIVILSKNFFKKEWPQKELDGLVQRDYGKNKVILPVWHGVTREDVISYSPILADKLAANSKDGLEKVIEDILKVVKPR